MKKYLLSSCVAIAFAQGANPAFAQQAPAAESSDDQGIQDIIVTAERHEQNIQKAPLTIQVLSGDDLAKAGVNDTLALQKVTNGVQIGSNGSNTQIFIRGVGTFSAGVSTSPGVAFNVDGVYVNQTFGTNGNFYDLARVEVLKGPQGTLYGRNATGGSINLITNQPRLGITSADITLEAGNYDLQHATGAINLPLGDQWAMRTAFNIVHRDGFLSDGQNDDVEQNARLRLKWQPSPDVSLLLNGDVSLFGGKGGDYVFLRPGAAPYESNTSAGSNAYIKTLLPTGPLLLDAKPDNRQDTTLYNVSAQLDWDLHFATLTLLPAYRHMDVRFTVHFNTRLETRADIDQSTFEARLGKTSGALTWVLGGFFYDEDVYGTTLLATSAFIPPLANSFSYAAPKTTSYAGFGQATVAVMDGLRLTGGARYTYERKTIRGSGYNTITLAPTESFAGRLTFNNVSYKAGVEYDLAPQNMLYASYSTGYKSGGFSNIVAPNTHEPEKLRAIEIGSKNRFLDNRLQLNLSGFHWKYKNIQDSRPGFSSLGNLSLITFNSGDATIYGGSLEAIARPTNNDTIRLSGEYAHSRYDQFAYLTPAPFFNPASTGCKATGPYAPGAALPSPANGSSVNNGLLPAFHNDCTGFQVARTPKWSGSASWAHDFNLANGGRVTVDGSVNYASARWLTIDFIPVERDNAYALVDANLTYFAPDDRWSVGLFGRNLTKTIYYSGGIQSGVLSGLVAANIGAPRTYGIRANVKFGS